MTTKIDVIQVNPRGAASELTVRILGGHEPHPETLVSVVASGVNATADIMRDDDLQLTLFLLYGLAYGSVSAPIDDLEWNPSLLAARTVIEDALEQHLRAVLPTTELPPADAESVASALFELTKPGSGPSVARFMAKKASKEHAREFLIQRSIYTLREADPHSWAIPRLSGRAKAALMEIQFDEYGSGNPERMHSRIFAQTMDRFGLDDSYGAYLDFVPALTLASLNTMSYFGLHSRLVGAVVGHLAAFEMTSSIPNRHYGDGFRRLGYGSDVTWYFDEHVEADAVHEQIAARDLAGGLAEEDPERLADIMFGAEACVYLDELVGSEVLAAWESGRSSLRASAA